MSLLPDALRRAERQAAGLALGLAALAAAAAPAATVPPAPTFSPSATASPASAPVRKKARNEGATPPANPIRIGSTPDKPDPRLEQAWLAFNAGDLDRAQAAWQTILQTDPRQADARHGLAAVAQRRGQPDRAADHYQRAIEADPKDAHALAALIALRGQADPRQAESRLKTLLAEQPDSPDLNFVLGNLLARDGRWGDARQVYSRAHAGDPGNPDYLFNLAVSLDHLRRPRLAAHHYGRALAAAAERPAGFDAAQAAARLKTLPADE